MEVAMGVYSVAAVSACVVSSCDSCFLFSFSGFATFPASVALVDSECADAASLVASAAGAVSLLVFAAAHVAFAAASAVQPVAFVAAADTPLETSAAGANLQWRLELLLDFAACLYTCVTAE